MGYRIVDILVLVIILLVTSSHAQRVIDTTSNRNSSKRIDSISYGSTLLQEVIENIDKRIALIESNLELSEKRVKESHGKSTEGGAVTSYFNGLIVDKITAVYFGETGQLKSEYYFDGDGLFYVRNKMETYDKPIYAGDAFVAKTEINKLYLVDGKIVSWIEEISRQLTNEKGNYAIPKPVNYEDKMSEIMKNVVEYQSMFKDEK